jgi:glycogen debranching enzyme
MPQPYLHRHLICVAAPATWLSMPSGQLTGGVDGLYVADRRVLSRLVVTVDGREPEPISAALTGAGSARFVGVLRHLGDRGPDPTVTCVREREVGPAGGTETITIDNRSRAEVVASVAVEVAADLVSMGAVKEGAAGTPVPFVDGRARAADGATVEVVAGRDNGPLRWRIAVAPRSSWSVQLRVRRCDAIPSATGLAPSPLSVTADDRRLDALVRQSVADLDALRLRDGDDVYYAAGSPWYLTLFGRDALWAARLALPLGTDIAAGTLRALARRQGVAPDPDTEEEPGKILHEVRPTDAAHWLPPVYYGSVDATALFVVTLAEAYRWGMAADEVRALLPHVVRALDWLGTHSPFVSYRPSGRGLSNQGWKDSFDGVQFADGRLAEPPLALSEVQAYAYQALVDGAWLLDTLGSGGGDPLRQRAKALAERFRAAFWRRGEHGEYPVIALDGAGQPVDGPASNMGHLLGTGLLDGAESARVARWLAAPDLAAPYGLRTLATTTTGYNPISYHAGSVWPHDTAIAVLGLVRNGHPDVAAGYVRALLAAAHRYDYRLPELYGGDADATPYPPACRPQAWSAAAGPALMTALLGLSVDAPGRRLTLRPIAPSPVGAFRVRGLRVAGGELDVSVDAGGVATVHAAPVGLQV